MPLLKSVSDPATRRLRNLEHLFSLLVPIPSDWPKLGKTKSVSMSDDGLATIPCQTFAELRGYWSKALKWTDGLDRALAVMLASVMSTKSVGDQLWVKIIGPASCGKSTLCEALSVAREYVLAKSTIRGFHSGYDYDDGEDHSLISQVAGKTLVTKDGDTLLQAPNLSQILSEARDVYDTVSRTHYRNKQSKDYAGIRMTWILCGTSSLRSIDSSELGERFLDCVIMDSIPDDLEDEILWRVANRAQDNLAILADGKPETHQEPALTAAYQATGGYVEYLRQNAQEILSQISMDDSAKRFCTRLGKFVAYMRARPSIRQDESAEREFAARLVSQHVRLSNCLAGVLNQSSVDGLALEYASQVSMDTARGPTLDICRALYKAPTGLTSQSLEYSPNRAMEKSRTLLRFLRQIGAIEQFTPKINGVNQKPRYRLTSKLRALYAEVMGVADDVPF